jgi:hypothetical protein
LIDIKWYHLVFTFDGAAGYFVNGVAASARKSRLIGQSHMMGNRRGDNAGFLPFVGGVDDGVLRCPEPGHRRALSAGQFPGPRPRPGFLRSRFGTIFRATASFSTIVSGTQPVTYQW